MIRRFNRWPNDANLHDQLNRFVDEVSGQLAQVSASIPQTVEAPAPAGAATTGGGVGATPANSSSVAAGTGISVSTSGFMSTVTNTGVVGLVAGTGITVSGPTGNVTIAASGSGATPFVSLSDATAGPVTVNLPAAAAVGQLAVIQKIDASGNGVAAQPAGTDLVNGSNSATSPITLQWDVLTLMVVAVGSPSSWAIIG